MKSVLISSINSQEIGKKENHQAVRKGKVNTTRNKCMGGEDIKGRERVEDHQRCF